MTPLPLQDRPQVREALYQFGDDWGTDDEAKSRDRLLATLEAAVRADLTPSGEVLEAAAKALEENTRLRAALRAFLEQGHSLGVSHPHFASYYTFPSEVWQTARALLTPETQEKP